MDIKIKWELVNGKIDTKEMKLVCIPARGRRICGPDEMDADLCISDGMNLAIAQIHTGDVESSNALCAEICRRFNEFPQNKKL